MTYSRNDFLGFRISSELKKKIEKFATEKGLTSAELMNISICKYIGDTEELNKILEKKVLKNI